MSESEQKFYQQSPIQGVDWPEDFDHENGNYMCECCVCRDNFYGHKRRVICKKCATKPEEQRDKTLGEIAHAAGLEVTPNIPWHEHASKRKSDWEHIAQAVAAEAVRRAQDEHFFGKKGLLFSRNLELRQKLDEQAELIRVLVEALKDAKGYIPYDGRREAKLHISIKEALRKAEGVL